MTFELQYEKLRRAREMLDMLAEFLGKVPMGIVWDEVMPLITQARGDVESETLDGWAELLDDLERLDNQLALLESIYYDLCGTIESVSATIDNVNLEPED